MLRQEQGAAQKIEIKIIFSTTALFSAPGKKSSGKIGSRSNSGLFLMHMIS